MKKLILIIIILFALTPLISALGTLPSNSLYVDANTTYPLVLIPTNNVVLNISLYTNGTNFNFTWTGSQYQLNLLFVNVGNYPFVISSPNVTGNITGTFLVRNPYNITFQFFRKKPTLSIFGSTTYINDLAFVTAELVDNSTNSIFKGYNPTLEKYLIPLQMKNTRYPRPMFHTQYINGRAVIKLYDRGNYVFRLIDGQIIFPYTYSVPNISKSYGTDVYLGQIFMNGSSQSVSMFLEKSDLDPLGTLLNYAYFGACIIALVLAVVLFFIFPQFPAVSIWGGVGFIILITIVRVGLWLYFNINLP